MRRLSYRDLHITTMQIPRTSILSLPFDARVTCTRASGWQVWRTNYQSGEPALPRPDQIGGEYGLPMRLDVLGFTICDSLGRYSRITGRQLAAARAMLFFTREELAARAGVMATTLSDFEREATKPQQRVIDALASTCEREGITFLDGGVVFTEKP